MSILHRKQTKCFKKTVKFHEVVVMKLTLITYKLTHVTNTGNQILDYYIRVKLNL